MEPEKFRILQRLIQVGVPAEYGGKLQCGLAAYAKSNKSRIPELVHAILPTGEDLLENFEDEDAGNASEQMEETYLLRKWLKECMVWLQWMMFEGDPKAALKKLADMSDGQRGVCGISWVENEIAYCCKTCEHDSTCAVCVPCFRDGNHKGHDYFTIYTTNGCCDCGDATAWKPEGFCSKHKGLQQIRPLQEEYSFSLALALDALLAFCKNKLQAEAMYHESFSGENPYYGMSIFTNELVDFVVEMLLEFCRHSESLLSLICQKMLSAGILDTLVELERHFSERVGKALRELLLKLIGDPEFKYEFSKVFVKNYLAFVNLAIEEDGDDLMKKLSVLPSFSVQLCTVLTLSLRLVKEENLLDMLLACLEKIFISCAGEDGCLVVSKWERLYEITLHVMHDIKYVLSNDGLPKYVATEKHNILSTWVKLLGFLQAMDKQKRETGIHVAEENDSIDIPFTLCHAVEKIHHFFAVGVFSTFYSQERSDMSGPSSYSNDLDSEGSDFRHAKVRLVSKEDSPPLTTCLSDFNAMSRFSIPSAAVLLINQCLEQMRNNHKGNDASGRSHVLEQWQVDYDVSSQEISVHLPLHRLLSLLLQKALKQYCGASTVMKGVCLWCNNSSLAFNHEFFRHVLRHSSSYDFSSSVMEHPLRVRVFCAQVHAGMWRKNGNAPLYTCKLYNGVSGYEPTLVKEMLILLIQIVKERRFCGLTVGESLKRELIHRLAVGDATHSQLLKSLPPELKKSDQVMKILDNVAVYSNPSGFKQGMYSLRQKYWKDLDLYHPQWRPKDLQVAEERYLRFCKDSAVTAQLPRWTDIHHPFAGIARVATCKGVLQIIRAVIGYACETDKKTSSHAPDGVLLTALHLLALALDISSLCQESNGSHHSEVPLLSFASEKVESVIKKTSGEHSLLSLLVLLMRMRMKEHISDVMETGSSHISSLIRSLLDKFAELSPGCMANLRVIGPDVYSTLSAASIGKGTHNLKFDSDKRKEEARLRQAAILAKMKGQQAKFIESISSTYNVKEDIDESIEHELVCSLCLDQHSKSSLSFPILLQKSRLVSLFDKGLPSWETAHEPVKKELLDYMNLHVGKQYPPHICWSSLNQRDDTTVQNEDFHDGMEVDDQLEFGIEVPCQSSETAMSHSYSFENIEVDLYYSIWRSVHDHINDERSAMIFIESSSIQAADRSFLRKYISWMSEGINENLLNSRIAGSVVDNRASGSRVHQFGSNGIYPAECDGIFISSCGHAVHQGCLDQYLSSLRERFNTRVAFEGKGIVDPNQGEFHCPVCRMLANSALPGCSHKLPKQQILSTDGLASTSDQVGASKDDLFYIKQGLCLMQMTANIVTSGDVHNAFPTKLIELVKPNDEPLIRALNAMYSGGNTDECSRLASGSHSVIMWDTLRYSLIAIEIGARSNMTSLTPSYGIDSLLLATKSFGEGVMPAFFEATEIRRKGNHADVLLRLKAIHLFARSLCSGHPVEESFCGTSQQGGNSVTLLNELKSKIPCRDAFFLELASGPVLTHDPFSLLMWVLFCLPGPFLTSKEAFISLVHIFYLVSVTQAIITYCTEFCGNTTDIDFQECLVNDILDAMGENKVTAHFFHSNYIDPKCGINNMMHRLTFPYLRRCALLSRLLEFSTAQQLLDGSTLKCSGTDSICKTEIESELIEIEKLRNSFGIPLLDILLKDQNVRLVVKKWYNHWDIYVQQNKLRNVMYTTPAVPFRLLNLPNIYQDLLQRYINQCCDECGSVANEPALCLLCGKLCFPFWKPCCRKSGCKLHAVTCSAGTGIYLLIKKTTIILHRGGRQAPWGSPYLDAYGEEDVGMKRGRPLYLNEERYATLCHMVATHSFDRDSMVLSRATMLNITNLMEE